jgi:tripartite-type tricarboxylate transporter receptor subunit TctC
MKRPRRRFLHLAAGAAVLPVVSRIARAQTYPNRPVRIFEGFGGGSSVDLISRLIGRWLSTQLGQPFVIQNRSGAAGNIATEAVASAAADGYTLLTCVSTNAINTTLYPKLNFDFARDIVPIAGLVRLRMVLLVNPAFPAKTVPEFIAYAKANPGKINMGTPGIGTPQHVAAELMKLMAGIDMVDVHYRGPAPAFVDLLGGQIQAFIIGVPAAIGYIKAGRLRALAVTSTNRAEDLPDVPAMDEFVPGFEATTWQGTCAPKNTPLEVIDKLNRTINLGLADPQLKAQLKDLGGDPMLMTPPEFGRFVADETEKWAKVIKFANIKPE